MNDAVENNQSIVYVSIGSECKWQQWSIDAIYEGLKNIGCKVIWSLRINGELKLPQDNPNIWVRDWIP